MFIARPRVLVRTGLVLFVAAAVGCGASPATSLKQATGDADAQSPIVQQVAKPAPTVAPIQGAVRPPRSIQNDLLETFRSYVGIKESPLGSNNGPMVDKFNASCGLSRSDHAPWCAAVAHYGYGLHGLKGRGAYSPSWFTKERRVAQSDVQPADVGLVWFPAKNRYAHTIACIEKTVRSSGRVVQVTTLEGNTNAQGSREGDQFARRIRPADTVTFVRWWNQ